METVQAQTPAKKRPKVWTLFQISLASYFAGPFAGCYLLGRNYRAFDQPKKAKQCYLVGLGVSLLIFVSLAFIPEELREQIPKKLIPIAYSSLIISFAAYYQHQKIKDFLNLENKRHSYFWLLLIAVVIALAQLLPVMLMLAFA